jgi:POT family proton-dependent oligopeptide transporter
MSQPVPTQKTFLGHPVGLYVLFFTEMWERFSYYGMRALLLLYMTKYFKWAQSDASAVFKWYTSLVYLTPIAGGFLADRYLGNRLAVIIGAALMAVGHFLMAFEDYPIFFAALLFLIVGNGFFKPNMSTQVGRLYPKNDLRRDGAYTIFYMGINIGAFLSPIICGWLTENTVGGFHSGFTAAGIGMLIGLITYLLGQKLILEIDHIAPPAPPRPGKATTAMSEAEAAASPSAFRLLNDAAPWLFALLSAGFFVGALWRLTGLFDTFGKASFTESMVKFSNFVMPWLITSGVFALIAYVVSRVRAGIRDRVLSIVILGLFVVFFWAAFEQAGNVLNLWAEDSTVRHLTVNPPAESVYPPERILLESADGERFANVFERFRNMFRLKPAPAEQPAVGWLESNINPVPTAHYQAINAILIVLFAPILAWIWTRVRISIPLKMFFGLAFMAASVAVMIEAARRENRPSRAPANLAIVPAGIVIDDAGRICEAPRTAAGEIDKDAVAKGKAAPVHGGRLRYDANGRELQMSGVLARTEFERVVRATAPATYRASLKQLRETLDGQRRQRQPLNAQVTLSEIPAGFDLKYAGFPASAVSFDPASQTLTVKTEIADKDEKSLLVAAADPAFRDSVGQLFVESSRFKVSSWWLLWAYLLATIGELCLSPVGLSMVSKLAPAAMATMLMGMWHLTSFFGNFAAGAAGELYGDVAPVTYFTALALTVAAAAVVLLFLVRKTNAMMHGVE